MTAPQFDGLAFVRAIQNGELVANQPPWITHLRLHEDNPIQSIEPGRLVSMWTPGGHFTMQDGVVQGGLVGAIADAGQSLALMSTLTVFEIWVTLDLHTRFARPIRSGTQVRVESVVVNKGRSVAMAETTFTLPDGKIAAKTTGGWRHAEAGQRPFGAPPQAGA